MNATDQPRRCGECLAEVSAAADRFCANCGAPLDAEATDQAEASTEPAGGALVHVPKDDEPDDGGAAAHSWWTRRKVFVVGVVVLLVAGAAGGFLWWQSSGDRDPAGPVKAFYAALVDGDAVAASKLLEGASTLDSGDLGDSPLWGADALSEGYQAPSNVEVEAVEHFTAGDEGEMKQQFPGLSEEGVPKRPDMDSAHVSVSYDLGDKRIEQDWILLRETEGVARDYRVINVDVGYVDVGDVAGKATVANAEVDGRVIAPPGVYDVKVTGSPLFEDVSGELVVEPSSSTDTSTATPAAEELSDLKIRPEVAEAVGEQIDDRIADCAKQQDEYTTGGEYVEKCPWVLEDLLDKQRAPGEKWTVKDQPRYEVTLAEGSSGEVIVETTHAGKAEATYSNALGDDKTMTALLIPNGTVAVEDGAVTWTYEPPDD